jgi:uncharacterized phage-associated protein
MNNISQDTYENTILYLCKALGGTINGKKKLAKLLYFIDFDRYEYKESMESVTGDTYEHWKMGPVPKHYTEVAAKLVKTGKLNWDKTENPLGYSPTEVFTYVAEPDMSKLDQDDIDIINHVVGKYGKLSGKELEILSHKEAPYIATEPNEEIPYDLAFYRETDFSDVLAATR